MSGLNEYGALARVMLCRPGEVFGSTAGIEREWRALNYTAPPDRGRAIEQYAAFESLVGASGAHIDYLSPAPGLTLDAVYVRDASLVTPRGVVLCRMGKAARQQEPVAQGHVLTTLGLPVVGAIHAPGQIEGGDVAWFNDRTVVVGRGYRTNDEGICQFRDILGPSVDMLVVPLPHYRGPSDVFHLMSMLSPVDRDIAVVYSPLMPVPFREWLVGRGIGLVEVPDEEFDSMGANVLAVAPRRCVMVEGNPVTRARLEAAGCEVATYDGSEISLKGGGGPTCLTRPLVRETASAPTAA
ncbi:MAG: arginine deiminase family protein [Acidobacteriota bacterium]|nr:arginine deiminase family protein [Acidobacteriota bacterium]